jgi:hypothetical protein
LAVGMEECSRRGPSARVDGRQYIAIATGLTRNSMGRLATTSEKRNLGKSATMIFVFAL